MIIKLVNVNEVSIIKDHRVVPYPVSAIWILHWNWTLHYFLMPTKLYNKCISGWSLKGRDLIVKCVFLDSNYSMNMFDYNCQWNVRNKMIFQHTAEVGDTHIWIYHRFFFFTLQPHKLFYENETRKSENAKKEEGKSWLCTRVRAIAVCDG